MTCFVPLLSFANGKAYDPVARPEDYEPMAHDSQPVFRMRLKRWTHEVLYAGFVSP